MCVLIVCGVSVTCANGEYTRAEDLPIDDFSRAAMDKTLAELEEERAGVVHQLRRALAGCSEVLI